MKNIIIFFLLAAGLTLQGCAWFQGDREMEKSAEELVQEGSKEFADKNYNQAIKAFTTLKDWYPFSKYAILAELKIADSHFELEEYEEAIFAYKEFERLHPKNEAVPLVIFRTGLCWFDRIKTVDRDQSPARNAYAEFSRLVKRFPESPLVTEAEEKIAACKKQMAGHEYEVARFYFKAKKYKAAKKRFEYLFAHYPDTEKGRLALDFIAQCREKIANK